MRASVIAVAGALVAVAAALLWLDRETGADTSLDLAPDVAAIAAPSPPAAVASLPIAPAPEVPPPPPRAAINRYLSDDRLLDVLESLRHSKAG